jgi:biopolymer transport protein ExbD
VKFAAAIFGLIALAACGRDTTAVSPKENINIAVDTEGKITLNGKPVTEEQLKAYLDSRSGTTIIEVDAAGKTTVTVDGKPMTAEEFAAYKRGNSDQ